MEVICKGYKHCEEQMYCDHSKPHEHIKFSCDKSEHNYEYCWCSAIFLREEKLKNLTKSNDGNL